MGVDQVGDLDVVAHAGAVAGRIVLAEDIHVGETAERRLYAALDQVGGVRGRLAQPPMRVAPATLK